MQEEHQIPQSLNIPAEETAADALSFAEQDTPVAAMPPNDRPRQGRRESDANYKKRLARHFAKQFNEKSLEAAPSLAKADEPQKEFDLTPAGYMAVSMTLMSLITVSMAVATGLPGLLAAYVALKGFSMFAKEKIFEAAGEEESPLALRACLLAGANPDTRNKMGETPLHAAIRWGSPEHVRILINAGADPDIAAGDGQTPIFDAVRTESMEDIEILLAAGANPEATCRKEPLIHYAVDNDMRSYNINKTPQIVSRLIEGGANPDILDERKRTPLHMAVMHYCLRYKTDLVSALLEGGANVNARDGSDATPLHYAILYAGDEKLCRFLIEKGADLDARAVNGMTPLMVAEQQGKQEIISLLRGKASPPPAPAPHP